MEPMFTINVKFNEASVNLPVSIFKEELFAYFATMDNKKKLETVGFIISLLKSEAISTDNDIIKMELKKIKKMID